MFGHRPTVTSLVYFALAVVLLGGGEIYGCCDFFIFPRASSPNVAG